MSPRHTPASDVSLTHPDRLYWPDEGVTKQALADYYAAVWPFMAPYVVNRPLALLRLPDGIKGHQRFFQKHAWKGMNPHIEEIADPQDADGEKLLRIGDFNGLVALVQSAVLEIHPWGATADNWERPDMVTMDLDPGEDVTWSAVIAAALELKSRLEARGLAAFVKTSGGKGLHVVTPLAPKAGWAEVKDFAHSLAESVSADAPDKYLATATKAKRGGHIYIDYLRNGRGNTAVAAYSTRARSGAPVSMPLDWSELNEVSGPAAFTLANVPQRLETRPKDPWGNFFDAAVPLE
ncbi:DNA polymerase domain-containing protein [Rhizobium leguminosarum]|uniref:DNA polymerase LigD, polymerase domain protein n=1 Tax=Rhizobium leguminosarum bv. trifolii (strain WSM1325) TaxID=395491 RepID=C6B6W4_RHILS|nr:non-homologous end-joining DNA ligase [Rhizobium leguminosarum]ACS59822.1 DNA polymerase LigD, polymerase domain protein [Rhizobium leguminosarum bv. trifolii WSM1325]MBY2993482.1 DNA polymerase domain-containing protein [Rhizobium leguminosarum]MBY2998797.1 DNA polymerase domain-containing protein [Rhizobium leguminosarum]MBY3056941.1 DNA polymerase domain-containing protein [Rhizobium leguminosarum]